MNYYQQKQQESLARAKAQLAQDSAKAFSIYGFDMSTGRMIEKEPELSELEMRGVLIELKKMRLRYDAHILEIVADKLERASGAKSCGCGCNGSKSSGGRRYETKSSSAVRQTNHFADAYQGLLNDREYERWCSTHDCG